MLLGCGSDEPPPTPTEPQALPAPAISAADIDEWMAADPDASRVVGVLTSSAHPIELRVRAGDALVHSYLVRDDMLDGVGALVGALAELPEADRRSLADAIAAGLREDLADSEELTGLTPARALGLLLPHLGAAERQRSADVGLDWTLVDFGPRSGSRAEIALAFGIDARRTERLLEAMIWERNQAQLVALAEHIAENGAPPTRLRAAHRAVGIERAYESDEFTDWIRSRLEEHLAEGGADIEGPATRGRIDSGIRINRLNFIRDGAIPALRAFVDIPEARERLEQMAYDPQAPEEQREAARAALPAPP